MPQDWLFQTENGVCDFRCAGLLIQDGKVLLQRDGNEYAVPGGHVQFGETGAEAVVREFREELGVSVQCGNVLWTEECFWQWKGKLNHTLSFYYSVSLKEDSELPPQGFWRMKDHPHVEMGWVALEEVKGLKVYPDFLKTEIIELRAGHFVSRYE